MQVIKYKPMYLEATFEDDCAEQLKEYIAMKVSDPNHTEKYGTGTRECYGTNYSRKNYIV